jgi:PmbA protein
MTSPAEQAFLDKVRPVARKLLHYARKEGQAFNITDAKVSIKFTETQKDAVENGDVSEAVSGVQWEVGVTLFSGQRALTFSKNTLDVEKLRTAMMDNMQVIHLVPENENNVLLEKEKVERQPKDKLDLYEEKQPTQEEMIDYALKYEAAASAVPGVKTTDRTSVKKTVSQSYVIATNGLERSTAATIYSASGNVIAEDANGMQSDGDYSQAHHFGDMTDPLELGRSAANNTVSKLGPVLPKTGEMPIVLNHDAGEQFFAEAVLDAIDGSAVFNGSTFLKGKVGEQVMSKSVTLVDDPTVVRGLSSGTLDSAGMVMNKVTFIKDGILKSFNASVTEARQIGIEPIGRNDGATNCSVLPGTQTPEELIKDIKEGIYIKGFNGGTVNTANGLHSREAYGLLIKDGKVTNTPVAGFVVSGNLKKMFMSVAVANDTPEQPNTRYQIAVPTMRINGCTIAGQ